MLDLKDWGKCYELAWGTNTSTEMLAILANHDDEAIRCGVARNPNTDKTTLEKLANDVSDFVREALTYNSNATSVLDALSTDPVDTVRAAVAYAPKVSEKTLKRLAQDSSLRVRMAATSVLKSKKTKK